jgi:hypothetical protein
MSWRKHFSEKAQKDYYFHSVTKRSQFDKPPDFLEECFLKVKISYINSPADSKKVAQSWSGNMLFSELLSKVMSKVKVPLFHCDKCEVQLWNYDDSKEPIVVSMEDSLSQTFAICDKIPEVEFLLYKLQSNGTPHIVKNDKIEQLLTNIKPELLENDRFIRNLNATLTNEEVEESLTNIEPQLSNKDQYTTNINNLWEEVKCAGEQQPQIYKEKVQIQVKQEETIPGSEDEYLNDKIEEKLEITANLPPLLMHLPNSESNVVKKLKRVRFLDSLDVNETGNFKSFAEPPRQYSRLGEYTPKIDSSDINDDVENEYSNNSTKWNRDNAINDYYDDNGSTNIDIEEEFEEQEDLSDDESCIRDNNIAKKKDGNRNSDKNVILKYEDINKSHYSAYREENSDEESYACDISSPIDHNNDDKELRMIIQNDPRILCCQSLGAQLGLERNGFHFYCRNSAEGCPYAHICIKSYPMHMVLERLALVPPAFGELLIPAYKEQKERERRQEYADRNKIKKYEDINKSHSLEDREEISDQKSCARDISSPIDHNNDDDREPLRLNPMIKRDGSRILCCNYLGAQLGLERNGVPFSCHNSARGCLYAHICIKSYPMHMVLERLALVPPAFGDLLIPPYKEQKQRERLEERNEVKQKAKQWYIELQKEKLKKKQKNSKSKNKKISRKKIERKKHLNMKIKTK